MGDLIEVKDTFTIHLERRMKDGKADSFELCMIYPEYMDHENIIIWFRYEADAYTMLEEIIKCIEERV